MTYCKDCKYFTENETSKFKYFCSKKILKEIDPIIGLKKYYCPRYNSQEKNKYNSCLYFKKKLDGKWNKRLKIILPVLITLLIIGLLIAIPIITRSEAAILICFIIGMFFITFLIGVFCLWIDDLLPKLIAGK